MLLAATIANRHCALQFEPLEAACVNYLEHQTRHMTARTLLCLAQLGDHLGLSTLEDGAIDALIQRPWVDHMVSIAQLLAMPKFQHDTAKIDSLLHHPNRGAYTELQALELLEMVHVSEDSMAGILKMDTMQPSELDILLGILVNTAHIPGMLLGKAVQQYRLPEGSRPDPDWSTRTRILSNIMMPNAGIRIDIEVPHCNFYLEMEHNDGMEDGEEMHWLTLLA